MQKEKILQHLADFPEILSDEEWKWLDGKVKKALTPPPGGDGFGRLSEEEDPGAKLPPDA